MRLFNEITPMTFQLPSRSNQPEVEVAVKQRSHNTDTQVLRCFSTKISIRMYPCAILICRASAASQITVSHVLGKFSEKDSDA